MLSNQVKKLMNNDDIISVLRNILQERPPLLAFDYETTGLKPDRPGHKLYCVSVCWRKDVAYSFPLLDADKKLLRLFKRIMQAPDIGKTAHNMKFEDRWTRAILGVDVQGWAFDTMLAAHVLDNRSASTGLKFNVAARLGVWDYDSHIKSYLKGHGNHGANNFNDIHKIPMQDLLQYCGMDSLVQYRLAIDMMEEIGIENYS